MTDISATLAERGGRYGQFINHATIAQGLQEVLHRAPNWHKLDSDMRQAMTVICDKFARILNGDPYYEDNWHDIQGYSKLVEDRILDMKQSSKVILTLDDTGKISGVRSSAVPYNGHIPNLMYQDANSNYPVLEEAIKTHTMIYNTANFDATKSSVDYDRANAQKAENFAHAEPSRK